MHWSHLPMTAASLAVLLAGCSDASPRQAANPTEGQAPDAPVAAGVDPQARSLLRIDDPAGDVWVVPHSDPPFPHRSGRSTSTIDATALEVAHTADQLIFRMEVVDLKPLGQQDLDVILDVPGNGSANVWAGVTRRRPRGFGDVSVGGPRPRDCSTIPVAFDPDRDLVTVQVPRRRCLGDPAWVQVEFISTGLHFGLSEGRTWSDNVAGGELGYIELPRLHAG